jgi:hypothetical protein
LDNSIENTQPPAVKADDSQNVEIKKPVSKDDIIPMPKPGTSSRVPARPEAGTGVGLINLRGVTQKQAQTEVDKKPEPVFYENTDDVLRRLEEGETVELNTSSGTKTISPNAAPFIREDPNLVTALTFEIEEDRIYKEGKVGGVKSAYMTPSGEVDYGRLKKIEDPSQRIDAEEYAQNRAGLLKQIRDKNIIDTGDRDIDNMVTQYTLDNFETGDAFESLSVRLAEAGRGTFLAIPYIDMYVQSSIDALKFAMDRGTTWSEEWQGLAPRRERSANRILNFADNIAPSTLSRQYNAFIRDKLQEDLEAGNITEEQFEFFMYEGTLGDKKIERAFFDDEQAYAMTEYAFSELSGTEQFAVILTENVLGGGIFAATKAGRAGNAIRELENIRKKYNISSKVPLQDVPALVRSINRKEKFNDSLLKLGFLNRRFKEDAFLAKGRRSEIKKEMNAIPIDQRNTNEYYQLKSEYDNLGRMARRNYLRTKINPFITEIAGAEVIIATTAYTAQALLPGYTGMSRDMAEVAGLFGGLLFHYPIGKATKGVVGGLGFTASAFSSIAFGGELRNPVPIAMRKLLQMDTTVDDYDLNVFAPANNGRRMNMQERRGVRRVFKFINEMSFEERQDMMQTIQQHDEMRKRILRQFPEGEPRQKAEKLFNATFAEATAIAPLISLTQEVSSMLGGRKLSKMGLSDVAGLYEQILLRRSAMAEAMKNFEEHVVEFSSPGSREAMKALVAQSQRSFDLIDQQIAMEFEGMAVALDNMLDVVASDPDTPLSPRFINEIKELMSVVQRRSQAAEGTIEGERLAKSGAAVVESAQEIQENRSNISTLTKGLIERFDIILTDRKDAVRHGIRLDSAAEAVLMTRNQSLMDEVEESYVPFRDFINKRSDNPDIDLSSMVTRMIDVLAEDYGSIDQVFGKGATFFSGFMGKRTRTVFEKMAKSSLNRLKATGELDTAIIEIAEASDGSLKPQELFNMMNDDPVAFSLIMHKSGKLNMFNEANIDEVDVMVRAFTTYANRTTNKEIQSETIRFRNLAEKAMKESDEEGYEMLQFARENMRAANDPKRKGTILYTVMQSYLGQAVDPVALGKYEGLYANVTPGEVFRKPAEALAKAMNGGGSKTKAIDKIQKEMSQMALLFGNYIDEKGELVIDLRTEEGRDSFNLLNKITTEYLYDYWATGALKKREAGFKGNAAARLDFRMSVQEELADFQDAFQVRVINEKGDYQEVNVADLEKILVDENDVMELTRKGGELEEVGKKVNLELRMGIRNAKRDSNLLRTVEDKQNKVLRDIAGISTDAQFYEDYVNGFKSLDDLKSLFMQSMRRDTEFFDSQGEEAIEKMFDEAVFSMTYRALTQIGGRKAIGNVREGLRKGLEEGVEGVDEYTQIDFANKVGLLAELTENKESLRKIFTDEQLENLIDITAYSVNKEALNVGISAAANSKSGLSMNEALSRAYNIARGMVSPTYVASEVTIRMLEKTGSDSFLLAMQNPDAARIMSKMMRHPSQVTKLDLNTLDILIQEFAFTTIAREGQEEIALAFLEDNYGMPIEDDEAVYGSKVMPRRGFDPLGLANPRAPQQGENDEENE